MRQLLPLGLSVITLVVMWQAGNRRWWAWALGLVNQLLWFAFVVLFDAWGLLPLSVALTIIYARNLRLWLREARRNARHDATAARIGYGPDEWPRHTI